MVKRKKDGVVPYMLKDMIEDVITDPLRSKVDTRDIRAQISSMKLKEIVDDMKVIIDDERKQAQRDIIINILSGHSWYLMCETCWVRSANRWGGAAMTTWNCARCKASQLSGSTAHGAICVGCALMTKKCENCNHNDNNLKEIINGS